MLLDFDEIVFMWAWSNIISFYIIIVQYFENIIVPFQQNIRIRTFSKEWSVELVISDWFAKKSPVISFI